MRWIFAGAGIFLLMIAGIGTLLLAGGIIVNGNAPSAYQPPEVVEAPPETELPASAPPEVPLETVMIPTLEALAEDTAVPPPIEESEDAPEPPPSVQIEPTPTTPSNPPKWGVEPFTPCENCGGGGDPGTEDADRDGMYDWMEEAIAQEFAPYYVFDENELWSRPCFGLREVTSDICINLPEYMTIPPVVWLYQMRPGTINGEPYLLFVITTLYDIDYVDPNFTSSILWHYGDTESLELYIHCLSGDCNQQPYWVDGIQINRHSEGHWYNASELLMVDYFGQTPNDGSATHLKVFVSLGKHGTYASSDECHRAEIEGGLDEKCNGGWAGVPPLEGLPANVGELNFQNPGAQGFANGFFPGERIWDPEYNFCGLHPPLSDSERQGESKFGSGSIFGINDFFIPFWEDKYVPNCAGSVGSKWFPFDVFDPNRQRPAFISHLQIQMGFLSYSSSDICMVKMGPPKSSNPSDGAIVATELLNGEIFRYGQTKIYTLAADTPYWFAFLSCNGEVVYEDILSCSGNCLFNVPP